MRSDTVDGTTQDDNDMTHRLYALAYTALLAISPAVATADEPARTAEILAQQQTIRAEMKAKRERYASMPRSAQKSVMADQDKLKDLLEGKSDLSELGSTEQAEVRRLIARIDATIANNQDERLVCTQEARTGSNYLTRVCRTPSEIDDRKEADQRLLKREVERVKCTDKNGCF